MLAYQVANQEQDVTPRSAMVGVPQAAAAAAVEEVAGSRARVTGRQGGRARVTEQPSSRAPVTGQPGSSTPTKIDACSGGGMPQQGHKRGAAAAASNDAEQAGSHEDNDLPKPSKSEWV